MPRVIENLLRSRKFWIFISGLLTLVGGSLQDGYISGDELNKIFGLFATYIISIAFEDGMSRRGGSGEAIQLPAPQTSQGYSLEAKVEKE